MSTLFNSFNKQSKADWLAKVTKDLKGKPIEDLDWQLIDGFSISPFAHREDFAEQFPPISNNRATNNWEIGAIVQVKDYTLANQEALILLEKGASAICFNLQQTPSKEQLAQLLENIQHEWMSTHFQIQQESWGLLAKLFLNLMIEKGQDLEKVVSSFELIGDPISNDKEYGYWKNINSLKIKGFFQSVNTCHLFTKKEEIINALAETIYQGNLLLVNFSKENYVLESAHSSIQFSISLTDSYFLNIALIRALKLLWQQIVHAWGVRQVVAPQIAVYLGTNTHTEDENYNKIKASAQAMAAVSGGADRLFIAPSDEKYGTSSMFSKRIALNIQHVMQLESYMDRVIDPAAGSYYIEKLTQDLAEAAWAVFQEKQNEG